MAALEDLFCPGESGLAGVGQRHAAAGRLEQLVAQVLLQFAHLGADGLDGHVQPLISPAGPYPDDGHLRTQRGIHGYFDHLHHGRFSGDTDLELAAIHRHRRQLAGL
ncbi:hypothetical protein G6F57_019732 [Rhizopus arrhizus]|nr:hypothetical protein G6F57_019732 [Rhizopus arrhizus]